MKEKKGFWKRFRSAITGLFVTKKYAEENPDTTFGRKMEKKKK